MKKFANVLCAVLILIGLVVAFGYAAHEETNEMKEKYEHGGYYVNENGESQYINYFDFGNTEKREKERMIFAGAGFTLYAITIIGIRYFIELKIKTKAEIKKMENKKGDDFLL